MLKVIPFLQLLLTLIFLSFIILGLDKLKVLSLPKTGLYLVTNPISFGLYKSSQDISNQLFFLFAARKAGQENKALKEQIGQLLSENATIRKKLAETESMLIQQKSLDPYTYKLLAARPVGLDRYLKIDKGLKDGVVIGQAVVFKDSFLGRIVQAAEKRSSIMLLEDPASKIAAFSINKDGRAKGILTGQFGSEMLLDKILHEEKIEQGDLVYSEGTEGYLPRGLILGRVSEVIMQENEVFKQAKVKPVFGIGDLDLVYLIIE